MSVQGRRTRRRARDDDSPAGAGPTPPLARDAVVRHDLATSEFVARVFAFGGAALVAVLSAARLAGVRGVDDARAAQIILVTAVSTLGLLLALAMLHAGRIALGNRLIIGVAFSGTVLATWIGETLPSASVLGFLMVVVMAAVLLPGRGARLVGAASLVAVLALALRQEHARPAAGPTTVDLPQFLAALVFTGAALAGILMRSTDRARRALAQSVAQQEVLERQNRELAVHEERLRCIVDNTRELVAELDAEGRIVYASPNHLEVTGRRVEDLIGRCAWDHVHADDRAQRASRLRAGGGVVAPLRVQAADGSWRWVEASLTPFSGPDGAIRVLSVARDVTTRVCEERRESQRREAESHAQKMDALGRLAGGITHELNNLMTVITLNVELLRGDAAAAEHANVLLEQIHDAAEEATTLTRRLLGLATRTGRGDVGVEVDGQIRDLERLLRPLVGENVGLDVALGAGDSRVAIGRNDLARLLLDFAVSARGASDQGGRIGIETRSIELAAPRECRGGVLPPGRYVALCVTDTGPDQSAGGSAHGSEPLLPARPDVGVPGPALAAVCDTVRYAGGDLCVGSAPGGGTRVEAFLPSLPSSGASDEVGPEEREAPRGHETVLVVEDQQGVRLAMARVVRTLGYRVLEAECAERALEIVRSLQEPLHLLLTDVVMPDMRGPELARRLRSLRPGLRVLYVTGYAGSTFPSGLPPDHPVLDKPAGRARLAAALRNALDAPAPPHAASAQHAPLSP